MARINQKEVLKPEVEILAVKTYCEKYGNGITSQGMYYAIDNDLVDYTDFGGREKYIVMTEKTRAYSPNESPQREAKI